MKKIIVLFTVMCASLMADAQVYTGGTLNFWRNDKDDADITTATIAPEIGFTLSNKWAIGTGLGYAYWKDGEIDTKINAVFVAPYVRYSFYEKGIVRLFIDGEVGFSSAKLEEDDKYADDERVNGYSIGLKPGLALKLTEKCSLITKFGFIGYKDDYLAEVSNGFGLDLSGENLLFGIQVSF